MPLRFTGVILHVHSRRAASMFRCPQPAAKGGGHQRQPALAASTSHCRVGAPCMHVPLKSNTTFMLHSPTYQQLLPTDSPRTSLVLMLRHPATRPRSCTSNQERPHTQTASRAWHRVSARSIHIQSLDPSVCLFLSATSQA